LTKPTKVGKWSLKRQSNTPWKQEFSVNNEVAMKNLEELMAELKKQHLKYYDKLQPPATVDEINGLEHEINNFSNRITSFL